MWVRSISAGVLGLALLPTSEAHATPAAGPPVHLLLRDCAQVREAEVERVLAAELGSETSPHDGIQDPTFIVATCSDQRVVIEVTDPISRKMVRRSFDLSRSSAAARARLIAIAASELVLASWAEIALRPPLRVEPEGPPPPSTQARAAAERALAKEGGSDQQPPVSAPPLVADESEGEIRAPRSWMSLQIPDNRRFRIVPLGSLRKFVSHDGALWGGGVRFGEEPLVNASWAVDALFESGKLEAKSVSYRVDSWTLAALIYLHARSGIFAVRAGGGLRGGLVASSGSSGESNRTAIPWGWPLLALNATIGEHALVEVSAEGSYAVLPVTATNLGIAVRGAWIAVQVGVGLAP